MTPDSILWDAMLLCGGFDIHYTLIDDLRHILTVTTSKTNTLELQRQRRIQVVVKLVTCNLLVPATLSDGLFGDQGPGTALA